ncbi:hypothetical protein DL765_004671 [Monosporascus sp. GIB2]|nr:hypothetical protein DL765_004671 [Monosporascus sp. GIB2]
MGIFGQKSKIKAAPQTIRVEKVTVPQQQSKAKARPTSHPFSNGLRAGSSSNGISSSAASKYSSLSPNPRNGISRTKSASPYPSSADERRGAASSSSVERKRKAVTSTPRDSPAFGDSSDDDGEDGDPFSNQNKRMRRSASVDVNRKLRHKKAFGDEERDSRIIHAADIASVATGCPPIPGAGADGVAVELQYPSRCKPERYELVWKKDKIDAVKDILTVVRHVADTYLTDEEAKPFIDHHTSFRRQMERAISEKYRDVAAFKAALNNYNESLRALIASGSVPRNIDKIHHLPSDLVAFILDQVYDRTVAPKVEILSRYEVGSDNVYGELLHPFITRILEQTNMTSEKVFVDLGSGVGNVVLQAALEFGCRSYGCESMENPCNLAEAQEKEFRSRCLLWGVSPGRVQLERGDFRTNKKILEVLKEADVVLVNNKAFTSVLNDALINMFLDLKAGCRIISLKSFVHENKTAINDVANSILDVQRFRYHESWVSWAAAEGEYYISTKK